MKRALTGIAAAAVVLGTIAPAAFASTTSGLTKAGQLPIVVNGSVLSNPYEMTGKDSGNTTGFFPLFYFNQALSKLGFTGAWNGNTWAITAPGVDASTISVAGGIGTGNTTVTVNGTVVKKFNTQVAKDPAAGPKAQATTYLPVYYINNVLTALGVTGSFSVQTGLSLSTPVAGPAANVKLSTATDLPANGTSQETLTATVVDANGLTVKNFSGFITVGFKNNQYNGAVSLTDPVSGNPVGTSGSTTEVYRVVNGVAKIIVNATNNPAVTDVLSITASYTQADGTTTTLPVQYATINSVAQKATSIKVTGPLALSNNTPTTGNVTAQVLDQDGQAITSGTYSVTFHLSGPAKWSDGSTADKTIGTIQNGSSGAEATLGVTSEQGVSGQVSVTATVNGLTAGTYSFNAVTAQAPAALKFESASQTGIDGGNRVKYTVDLVDASGNPAAATSNITLNLNTVNADDDLSFYGVASGGSTITTVTIPSGSSSASFYVTSGTVGSVNFTATDAAGNFGSASATAAFTANTYDHIDITPSSSKAWTVAASNPTQTVTIQTVDANDNAVAASQYVALEVVDADGTANTGFAKINGQTGPVVLSTDSTGKISATVTFGGYLGDNWVVKAVPVATPTTLPNFTAGNAVTSGTFTINYTNASQVNVSLATNSVNSGASDLATVTVQDANGVNITSDELEVITNDKNMTITSAGGTVAPYAAATDSTHNAYTVTGGYTFNVVGGTAGTQSFVVKDLSSPSAPSTTKSIVVNSGTSNKIITLTPNGDQKPYGIASGTTIAGPFTVELADSKGNPVVASQDTYVSATDIVNALTTGSNDVAHLGGVRLTSTGSDVQNVKIAAGTSSVQVYAEVTTAGQLVPSTSGVSYSSAVPSIGTLTANAINNSTKAAYGFSVGVGGSASAATATITDGTHTTAVKTGSVSGGTATFSGIDASTLADGNVTITVTATDANSNSVTQTFTVAKDVVAPAISAVHVIDATHIDVVYSEAVTGVVATGAGYTVSDSATPTAATYAVSAAAVDATNKNTVHLTVADTTSATGTLNVAYASASGTTTDLAGNAEADTATPVSAS